jgi:hypothetical protein
MLDSSAEGAAAQQHGVHDERVGDDAKNHSADQSVVTETVPDTDLLSSGDRHCRQLQFSSPQRLWKSVTTGPA